MLLEQRAPPSQLEVEAAERGARVAGDEARGAEAGARVGAPEVEQEPDERLDAGQRDAAELGRALGARPFRIAPPVVRAVLDATWRLRLQPTPPGWLDMAMNVPLMDTTRIREELGWEPQRSSTEAVLDVLHGMRDEAGAPTPPLEPGRKPPSRV